MPTFHRALVRTLCFALLITLIFLGFSSIKAGGSWSPAAPLAIGRLDHTATLLHNGPVLIVGGTGDSGPPTSAELYDRAANPWSLAAPLAMGRVYHTATLLHNGQVLIVGGTGGSGYLASAEVYDPVTNAWS